MMNRYLLYIIASIMLIAFPMLALIFGLWYEMQPRVGPMGNDSRLGPSLIQLIPFISTMAIGAISLPIAIVKYIRYMRQSPKDVNND